MTEGLPVQISRTQLLEALRVLGIPADSALSLTLHRRAAVVETYACHPDGGHRYLVSGHRLVISGGGGYREAGGDDEIAINRTCIPIVDKPAGEATS